MGFEISSKIFVFMHFFYHRDGWPAMGHSSFFWCQVMWVIVVMIVLVVGWWCVRNNLADFNLFRSISGVCSFFCLKKSLKKT